MDSMATTSHVPALAEPHARDRVGHEMSCNGPAALCSIAAAPLPWRATSARPRASRSPKSPLASAARPRRSRLTSTTRPARRPGLQGQAPRPLRAMRRTDRCQEERDALPALLAGERPGVCRSVSDVRRGAREEAGHDDWAADYARRDRSSRIARTRAGPPPSQGDAGRSGTGAAPVSSMHCWRR